MWWWRLIGCIIGNKIPFTKFKYLHAGNNYANFTFQPALYYWVNKHFRFVTYVYTGSGSFNWNAVANCYSKSDIFAKSIFDLDMGMILKLHFTSNITYIIWYIFRIIFGPLVKKILFNCLQGSVSCSAPSMGASILWT